MGFINKFILTVMLVAFYKYHTGESAPVGDADSGYESHYVIHGPCVCGFDESNINVSQPLISLRPLLWITCNKEGRVPCIKRCKAEVKTLLNRYCKRKIHHSIDEGYLYYSLCNDDSWINIKGPVVKSVCCHDKHQITCEEKTTPSFISLEPNITKTDTVTVPVQKFNVAPFEVEDGSGSAEISKRDITEDAHEILIHGKSYMVDAFEFTRIDEELFETTEDYLVDLMTTGNDKQVSVFNTKVATADLDESSTSLFGDNGNIGSSRMTEYEIGTVPTIFEQEISSGFEIQTVFMEESPLTESSATLFTDTDLSTAINISIEDTSNKQLEPVSTTSNTNEEFTYFTAEETEDTTTADGSVSADETFVNMFSTFNPERSTLETQDDLLPRDFSYMNLYISNLKKMFNEGSETYNTSSNDSQDETFDDPATEQQFQSEETFTPNTDSTTTKISSNSYVTVFYNETGVKSTEQTNNTTVTTNQFTSEKSEYITEAPTFVKVTHETPSTIKRIDTTHTKTTTVLNDYYDLLPELPDEYHIGSVETKGPSARSVFLNNKPCKKPNKETLSLTTYVKDKPVAIDLPSPRHLLPESNKEVKFDTTGTGLSVGTESSTIQISISKARSVIQGTK